MREACRHCLRRKGTEARGLCRACHGEPGIRVRYPAGAPGVRLVPREEGEDPVPDFCGWAPPPPRPTAARPGSAAKLAVMGERARLGVQLFHPDDARGEPNTEGG